MALIEAIISNLKRLEGYRQFPYLDTLGVETVGYGRNLRDKGITEPEAATLLYNDVAEALSSVRDKIPFFDTLTEKRQAVLAELAFQLGIVGLLKFQKMLAAAEEDRWEDAAAEILSSLLATQSPNRAKELAARLL